MNLPTDRRGFLGRIFTAATVSAPLALSSKAATKEAPSEDWMREVNGKHRCLFDFPQHKGGLPLLHMLNFLNTYANVYKLPAGQVSAVGTFYGLGPSSSIGLAFTDAMWEKYRIAEHLGLKDGSGKPYTRNVFFRPEKGDLHLLIEAMGTPNMPAMAAVMPNIGIENLQKMGSKFLICQNAFGGWCGELEASGRGKTPEIMADLKANLLPGVTFVPAMVIAIEKAQDAGIRYNRQ